MPLEQTGFVPPPYPYDRLDTLAAWPTSSLVASSTSRSAPRAIRRRRRWWPRCLLGQRARLPAQHRYAGAAAGGEQVAGAPVRRRRAVHADRRLRRHEGIRRHAAPVAPAAPARSGHGPLPGGLLPDVRDGGDPGRVPSGAGAAGRRPPSRRSTRSIPRTPPGRSCCGSTARATRPGPSTTWRGGRVGPHHGVPVFSDECYVRVHVGRSAPHDPRARTRRRGRRPLAVEAVEPGRPAGRLLRRRRRARRLPAARCASTSA